MLFLYFSYQNNDKRLYINVNPFSHNSHQRFQRSESNNVKIESKYRKEEKWKDLQLLEMDSVHCYFVYRITTTVSYEADIHILKATHVNFDAT